MAPNGVRDDGTDTSTRAGTDWGRVGALWGAVGVLVAIVLGVLQLMHDDRPTPSVIPPSATSTAPAATPDPRTEPTQPDGSTTDPARDPTADPTQSAPSRGGGPSPNPVPVGRPSISVSPSSVNLGGEIVIRGSGFPQLSGLHIRWFSTSSISYELGRNVPADENGDIATGGPMENPAFCGAGTVAVFTESGSSFQVPGFSEALATAPAVVRC